MQSDHLRISKTSGQMRSDAVKHGRPWVLAKSDWEVGVSGNAHAVAGKLAAMSALPTLGSLFLKDPASLVKQKKLFVISSKPMVFCLFF